MQPPVPLRVAAPPAPVVRWGALGAAVGLGAGSLLAGSVSALAGYFARRVVTPSAVPVEDLPILALVQGADGPEVILPAQGETTTEGRYSLFFDGDRGHARIGRIVSFTPAEGTVSRAVERVYSGDLSRAVRGRLSGVVFESPADAGAAATEVPIEVPGGSAPAWLVPGTHRAETWAVMVHGRGANRRECLRALGAARRLGVTSLLISYRNDGLAPPAPDGRYGLGATEWADVEAAIDHAVAHGARDVVLFGWSMGGAISLQVADRSRHRHRLRALVLDGPVVNWVDVLAHQARVNRIPVAAGRLGQWLLGNPAGRRLTGMAAPVDLRALDWEARAEQLRTPTLILHSEDDGFVPVGPSAHLAQLSPELVEFVRFTRAGHTHEWNVDPQRWDDAVVGWLSALLDAPRPGAG